MKVEVWNYLLSHLIKMKWLIDTLDTLLVVEEAEAMMILSC